MGEEMNELEATRAKLKCLEMVEGTGLDWWKCIKHQGYILGGYPTVLIADKEEYEFALGVVEGKPVWEGDKPYDKNGNMFYASYAYTKEYLDTCSWNPPKPATVMVELRVEDARYIADHVLIEAATACRKALEGVR